MQFDSFLPFLSLQVGKIEKWKFVHFVDFTMLLSLTVTLAQLVTFSSW